VMEKDRKKGYRARIIHGAVAMELSLLSAIIPSCMQHLLLNTRHGKR